MSKMSFIQRIRKRYNRFSGLASVRCLDAFHPWLRWLILRPGTTGIAGSSGAEPHFRWRRPVIGTLLTEWSSQVGLHLKLTTVNLLPRGQATFTTIRRHRYSQILHQVYGRTQHNHATLIGSGPVTREAPALQSNNLPVTKYFLHTIVNNSSSGDRHDNRLITQHFNQNSRSHTQNSFVSARRAETQTSPTHRIRGKNDPQKVEASRRGFAGPLDNNPKTLWQKTPRKPILLREIYRDRAQENPAASIRILSNPATMSVVQGTKPSVTINPTITSPQFESSIFKTMRIKHAGTPAAEAAMPHRKEPKSKTSVGQFKEADLTSISTQSRATPKATVDVPRYVYLVTPSAPASHDGPQREVIQFNGAEVSSEDQLEQKIAKIINEKYRHFDQKPINAKRVARDALSKLERQLVRENERLGRMV